MSKGIDSHAHLDVLSAEEREAVLAESGKALSGIVTSGIDYHSSMESVMIASASGGLVHATVGVAPDMAEKGWAETLELAGKPGVVGFGEIGLDRKRPRTGEEWRLQMECFSAFIDRAEEKGLPLVVHSRQAEEEVVEFLSMRKAERVLLHCFSGSVRLAENAVARGWLFSVPLLASSARRKVAAAVPLGQLVLESDAPFMGKKPTDILMSAQIIAREKNLGVEKVLAETAANAKNFFRLV